MEITGIIFFKLHYFYLILTKRCSLCMYVNENVRFQPRHFQRQGHFVLKKDLAHNF